MSQMSERNETDTKFVSYTHIYTYIYIHIYIPHHPQVNMYIFTIVRTRTCYYTTIACGKVILKKSKRMRKEKTDRDPDLEVSDHDHR
jgi:hypothetical protein